MTDAELSIPTGGVHGPSEFFVGLDSLNGLLVSRGPLTPRKLSFFGNSPEVLSTKKLERLKDLNNAMEISETDDASENEIITSTEYQLSKLAPFQHPERLQGRGRKGNKKQVQFEEWVEVQTLNDNVPNMESMWYTHEDYQTFRQSAARILNEYGYMHKITPLDFFSELDLSYLENKPIQLNDQRVSYMFNFRNELR